MHHVLLNLKSFFKSEKLVFFIMLICVISSAFIINFAYGLYHNYDTQKTELNIDAKNLYPAITEGSTFTKSDLKRYAEALDEKTLSAMEVICAVSHVEEFPSSEEDPDDSLYMRFVIHDGEYGISEITRKAFEEHGILSSGRYITNEEERNGSYVAIVLGEPNGEWIKVCRKLKNDDGTINLFGHKYEVIGVRNGGGGAVPYVPFLTVPDDITIFQLGFTFKRNMTRSMYNDLVETAMEEIPGILQFPELQLPDNDTIAVYNNVISIAFFISIVSVVNFAMLYHFIIEKRQRNLAIMRMCGCTKSRAVFTYLAECIIITLPCYAVGTLLNAILGKNVFGKIFDFFEEAYTPKIYLAMFAVYFIAFIIILTVMISKTITRTIVREWKE